MHIKFKLIILSLILILFLLGEKDASAQQQSIPRVLMVSRIDFVPEILDMVRKSLMRKASEPVSLAFQPLSKDLKLDFGEKSTHLLLEDGIPTDNIAEKFEKTSCCISLIWTLIAKKDFYEQLSSQKITLENFGKALVERKKSFPHVYPWFESLYSKSTFLNFYSVFGKHKKSNLTQEVPFWQHKGAIRILYRAMEQGLLNPLSVEADQLLATNVFLAGDSVCFTFWVPIEFLDEHSLVLDALGDVVLLPFPGISKSSSFPRITFHLWKRKNTNEIECHGDSSDPEGYIFSTRNFLQDFNWMEEHFSEAYDMLIMGDF